MQLYVIRRKLRKITIYIDFNLFHCPLTFGSLENLGFKTDS